MEHRYVKRHAASVKTLIYKDGLPLAIGRLRNVSRQGFFIVSDYDNVAANQLLEIEFLDGPTPRKSRRRCRAFVAHKAVDGIGLAVDETNEVSCELLEDMLVAALPRRAVGGGH